MESIESSPPPPSPSNASQRGSVSPRKAPSAISISANNTSPSRNPAIDRISLQNLTSSPSPSLHTGTHPALDAAGGSRVSSPVPSRDITMDVDDDHQELPNEEDGRGAAAEVPELSGTVERCLWAQCEEVFRDKQEFYGHVKDHINSSKEFSCEWRTCTRTGQKQGRSLLLTHIRGHTGERPYDCLEPGCGKAFARTDALNKHRRTVHAENADPSAPKPSKGPKQKDKTMTPTTTTGGTGKGKGKGKGKTAVAESTPTRDPASASTTTQKIHPPPSARPPTPTLSPTPPIPPLAAPDEDLLMDSELNIVIPRLRSRWPIVPETDDEILAIKEARRLFPRHRMFPEYTGEEMTGEGERHTILDDLVADPYDDPVPSSRRRSAAERARKISTADVDVSMSETEDALPPLTPLLVHSVEDPDDREGEPIDILGRSRWQYRYVMAKARLMLLEEENFMRRNYLRKLLEAQQEAKSVAPSEEGSGQPA